MNPYKYLGWLVWPVADETTGNIVAFDIHAPGEWVNPYDTFATEQEARAAIRYEHRNTNTPTPVG